MNTYARFAAALTSVVLGLQVVHAATESRQPSTLSGSALDTRLQTEVVGPLRERHLGWQLFTRAGPRWDADALRAVAEARPGADGWVPFRVEAPSLRRPGAFETVWTGRVHATSGRIELAPPYVTGKAPQWRPLADVLKGGRFVGLKGPAR